ncbi:MAG: 3-oxoadipate enol-lactonase [Acidobacteriota bacterium]|jgi:3-oxoadipate enol-lactonase/4-carboxymuconolactone decarboxylase|nr:MAG: 3-oxoadipate enol-lactonase [Acidobacteriota bacterium]
MPFVDTPDGRLYYRLEGASGPVVVLSHSLGLDHGQWAAQAADLQPHFRILRYDHRGHGASDAPDGDYTIEQLGRDVLALVDALDIERFAFCGLSLGGMVGQWLGMHASERLTHLVLANTTARVAEPAAMEERRKAVLEGGMAAVVDQAMSRFFQAAWLERHPPVVAEARRTLLATSPVGYAGCCAAIRDMDHRDGLGSIDVPTLVIAGDYDVSMPYSPHAEQLAAAVPASTVVRLHAAHLSNLEQPRSFSAALFRFLLPRALDSYDAGMPVRRAVLGDAHVDRALAGMTDFTRDFQELITRYAWGTIWMRPGLDVRTRRLLVLAMTAAMGRWEEFRLHVRTGVVHELEWADLEEVLLQVAVYAGVPAANTAFHLAAEERLKAGDAPAGPRT